MDELELKHKNEVELIAKLYYRTYRPSKMTYEDVIKLTEKAYEHTKNAVKALDLLDESLDPKLTYDENIKRLEKAIAKPEELAEEEKEEVVEEFPYRPPDQLKEFYDEWMLNYKIKFKY